jgi:two-component system sensor kinase FixL
MLVVAGAYYAGANLGFILRLPPSTPSVLWPPNSILTATLLLTPTRRWGLYLLAALPAHLAVEMPVGWPPLLVLGLFVTNCSEALLAAGCLRAFGDDPTRFDTLRRVVKFVLAAALFAPFASSFFDAAAVASFIGEPYWLVWRTRFVSNVLTAVTVVPAIVIVVASGREWLRRLTMARALEAALIGSALVGIGITYIDRLSRRWELALGLTQVSIIFFLPFILWAAVRFGPGGASISLLLATLVTIWSVAHEGLRTVAATSPDGVVALQMLLAVSAVPLLCLAAVIEEHRRDEAAIAERLWFEELLARLSGAFVHLPSDQMNDALAAWLARVGEFFGTAHGLLLRASRSDGAIVVSHTWPTTSLTGFPLAFSRDFPWLAEELRNDRELLYPDVAELPAAAARDKAALVRHGITGLVAVPLVAGASVLGGLVYPTTTGRPRWPVDLLGRLRLAAEVFANALLRKETEDALRASELMSSAILGSLDSRVGVIDHKGNIIAANPAWHQRNPALIPVIGQALGVGRNYLDACRDMALGGDGIAADALGGVEDVLDGRRTRFSLEYQAGDRWIAMTVVPLNRREGGAVVSQTDITERKRAEMEAQRSRHELAHFTRVSAMGELTASLAHELNQPLAGILTNAQAARRFLDMAPLDVEELRDIIADIIDDDRRAADVIQRLRDLLTKTDVELHPLDLDQLISEVLRLLASDAVIRNVVVMTKLDAAPATVNGDRVQLQQVVLNLVLNAMDVIAETRVVRREILVETESGPERVLVSVSDSGPGLAPGTEELVFEPFYTTKATGMGMGLAIARSIIEAHGGTIWAQNNPGPGARFAFQLPLGHARPA